MSLNLCLMNSNYIRDRESTWGDSFYTLLIRVKNICTLVYFFCVEKLINLSLAECGHVRGWGRCWRDVFFSLLVIKNSLYSQGGVLSWWIRTCYSDMYPPFIYNRNWSISVAYIDFPDLISWCDFPDVLCCPDHNHDSLCRNLFRKCLYLVPSCV